MSFLDSITHLYLNNNAITSIESLNKSKIQVLYLTGNCIKNIGILEMDHLTELYLENQTSDYLQFEIGWSNATHLSILNIDGNTLKDVTFGSINTVSLRNCKIELKVI